MRQKVAILEQAYTLYLHGKAGPSKDQAGLVEHLRSAKLEELAKKFEKMTPKEFEEEQQRSFDTESEKQATELSALIDKQPTIGSDEKALLDAAVRASSSIETPAALMQLGSAAEEKWLANFPEQDRERYKAAREERFQAWIQGDRDAPLAPFKDPTLLLMDDPFADVKKEKIRRLEILNKAFKKSTSDLHDAVEQLRKTSNPTIDPRVEKILEEARERKKKEGEGKK